MVAERVYTPEYAPSRERKVRRSPRKQKNNKIIFNAKAKKNTVFAIVLVGILLIAAIVTTTITAGLAYANSQLTDENDKLANDILTLKVDMKSASNISTIEKVASGELGMIYPTDSQYVKLENNNDKMENFAAALKEEAFK